MHGLPQPVLVNGGLPGASPTIWRLPAHMHRWRLTDGEQRARWLAAAASATLTLATTGRRLPGHRLIRCSRGRMVSWPESWIECEIGSSVLNESHADKVHTSSR
jgi:hypothetical protein